MAQQLTFIDEDLIYRIYEHINHTHKQNMLVKSLATWNMLCIALDTLEDTMLAVKHYTASPFPKNDGGKYLYIFGLMQSLFVQQDAISAIYKALFNKLIDYKEYPELNNIRNIRNDIVGHPTGRGKSKENPDKFMSITRISISKENFRYYTEYAKKIDRDYHEVNVFEIINIQNKGVNMILEDVLERLDLDFKKYIETYKDKKMYSILLKIRYANEKLLGKDLNDLAWRALHINTIKSVLVEYKKELSLRFVSWEETDEKYYLESIEKMLAIIENNQTKIHGIDDKLERFLFEHIFFNFDRLKVMASETDDFFKEEWDKIVKKEKSSAK